MSHNNIISNWDVIIAWFAAASAKYLDLGLDKEQLLHLNKECLEIANFYGVTKLKEMCGIELSMTCVPTYQDTLRNSKELGMSEDKAAGIDQNSAHLFELLRSNLYDDAFLCLKNRIISEEADEKKAEMRTYLGLGSLFLALHKYDDAIFHSKECLNMAQEIGDKDAEVTACMLLGDLYFCKNDHENSITYLKKCLLIAQEIDVLDPQVNAHLVLARVYLSLKQYEDAEIYGRKCLCIAQEMGWKIYEMNAYQGLGDTYFRLRRYDDAILHSKKSLAIAKEIGMKEGERNAYMSLSETYLSLEKYDEAILHSEKCLQVAQETSHKTAVINAYLVLSKAYLSTEKYDDAIRYSYKCLSTAQETGNKVAEMKAYETLGGATFSLEEYDNSILFIQKFQGMAHETCDKISEKIAYMKLASISLSLKKYEEAILYGKECLRIVQENSKGEDATSELSVNIMIGSAYLGLGKYDSAAIHSKKALDIAEDIGDKEGKMSACKILGNAYYQLEEHNEIMFYSKKCLDMAQETGNQVDETMSYMIIGRACLALERYDEAISNSEMCIRNAQETGEKKAEMNAYETLGKVYFSLKKYHDAIAYNEKCLGVAQEINEKEAEASAYVRIGDGYTELEKFDEALFYSEKYLHIAKESGSKVAEKCAYSTLASRYLHLENYHDAIHYSKTCLDISQETSDRKAEMIAYMTLGDAYVDLKTYDEAIFYSKKCLCIAQECGNKEFETKACMRLQYATHSLEEYDEAILYSKKLLDIAQETNNKASEMIAYLTLADVHSSLKKYDDVIRFTNRSIVIAQETDNKNAEMDAYEELFNTYVSLEKYDDAILCCKKCLELAQETANKDTEMKMYLRLQEVSPYLKKHDDVLFYCQKCLVVAHETGDKRHQINAYNLLANTYLVLKRYEDAIHNGEKGICIAQETDEKIPEMNMYVTLAKASLALEKYNDAILYSEKCLGAQETVKEKTEIERTCTYYTQFCGVTSKSTKNTEEIRKELEILAYSSLAKSYYSLKRFDDAVYYSKKYVEAANQITEKSDKVTAFLGVPLEVCKLGNDFEDVIHLGKQCAELAKETCSKDMEMYSNKILGEVYYDLKEYEDSRMHIAKYLHIASELGDKHNEAHAFWILGKALSELTQYDKAMMNFKTCIGIAKEINQNILEMKAYMSLVLIHLKLAQYDDALHCCNVCKKIAKKRDAPLMEIHALLFSGFAFMFLNQYGDSFSCVTEGLRLMDCCKSEDGKEDIRELFNHLRFNLYEAVGISDEEYLYETFKDDFSRFREEQRKVFTIKTPVMLHRRRYFYYRSRKEYEQAIACLRDALTAAALTTDNMTFVLDTLLLEKDIADMYFIVGQYEEAIKYFQDGLTLAKKYKNHHFQALCYCGLGTTYDKLKQSDKAEESFRGSVTCFEFMFTHLGDQEAFKITFVDKYKDCYQSLLKVLIERKKNEEALLLSDRFRARALKDLLVSNYGMKKDTAKAGLQYTDVQAVVSTNNLTILMYSTCFKELYRFLVEPGKAIQFSIQHFSYCDGSLGNVVEKALGELKVRQVLNCNDRALESSTVQEENISIVLQVLNQIKKENSLKHRSLTCESRSPGNESEKSDESSKTSSLEKLHQKLLPKVTCQHDELVIIPDGPLYQVPFAALRDPDSGRYLSETKRIRLAPSIATLKLLQERSAKQQCTSGALIIGDPLVGNVVMNGEEKKVSSLGGALEEAADIALILGMDPPLLRQDATKAAVIEKLLGVSIVHIAAHGNLEKATILLAPSPETRETKIPDEEDYMLTMADVQQAQVRAQLVVLSCCHSGRGEIRAEGVVGMCRAFLASGARAVVASLWAIDDKATRKFMKKFYKYLKKGKSASTSLHLTMNYMRQHPRYSDPKYWAAFFLMGDDVTVQFQEQQNI